MTSRGAHISAGWVVLAAVVITLAACGNDRLDTGATGAPTTTESVRPTAPRNDTPDFVGTIVSISLPATLLVEASRSEPVGTLGDKASLRVADATAILVCGPTDARVPGTFDQLAVGQPVWIHVDGPVAESYPVQATASAISAGSCD